MLTEAEYRVLVTLPLRYEYQVAVWEDLLAEALVWDDVWRPHYWDNLRVRAEQAVEAEQLGLGTPERLIVSATTSHVSWLYTYGPEGMREKML